METSELEDRPSNGKENGFFGENWLIWNCKHVEIEMDE